jgi:hypothetical protein
MNEINSKISETLKGSIWIHKENETKYIKQNELDRHLNDGWKLGINHSISYKECSEKAKELEIKSISEWRKMLKNLTYHIIQMSNTKKNGLIGDDFLQKKNRDN